MDPQEGDIAEDGSGNFLVYRGGEWFPAQEDGRPLERIPRPDYGAGHYQLPNGDIVRQGPRGGQETVENYAGAGGGSGGSALVGADARARFMINLGPLQESQRILEGLDAEGFNPGSGRNLLAAGLEAIPFDGGYAARVAGGGDYNTYTQAAKTFEAAILPIMSGAAVTPTEAQRLIRAALPQPGDTPEVLAQKSLQRRQMINAVAKGIGQDAPFAMGDQAPAESSAAAPAEPGASEQAAIDISGMSANDLLNLQPGQYIKFPDGRVERLSGAPRVGAAGEEVSPGVFAEQQTPEAAVADRRDDNGILRRIDAGVRGAADAMTFGFADEIAAAGDTLIGRGPYDQSLARQRAIDDADAKDVPVSRGAGQAAGAIAAPGALAAGKFVANAPRLGYAMTRGAATGGAYGAAYGAGSAEGGFGERAEGAGSGLMTGALIGGGLPPLARGAGALTSTVTRPFADFIGDTASRFTSRPMTGEDRAVRSLLRGSNLSDMEDQAMQFRAQGVEPTIADIGGSNVQSRTRVAATRQTPGRDTAEGFAAGRRQDVQEYTAGLGERVSPIRATPEELDTALQAYQRDASKPAFDVIRNDRISLDPDSVMALRGEQGRTAIREAARAFGSSVDENERAIAAELNRLAEAVIDQPNVEITVGAADLMSRYLQKAGGTDLNLRRVFGGAGRAIRDNARTQSGGYDEALKGYAQRASLSDAASAGEAFVGNRGHAQDYVRAVGGMNDAQRGIAAAAGRAGIERAAETPAGSARVLDAMATGRGQQQRSTALLGAGGAQRLREGAQIGRRMMTTAQNVNPRGGSNTFLNASDGQAQAAGNLLRGRPVSAALDFIRSRGLSDKEAETIVSLAVDPSRTDEVLNILRTRFPEQEARRIIERITPMISGQAGGATAPQAQPVRMVGPQP